MGVTCSARRAGSGSRPRAAIEARLHLVSRFRQIMYRPRRGLGGPATALVLSSMELVKEI
jgi:hypothetical protein